MRIFIPAAVAFLLLSPALLAEGEIGVEIHPSDVTTRFQTIVGVSGSASCPYTEDAVVDLVAKTITIVLHLECPILPDSPGPFLYWHNVGFLEAGKWAVRIEGPFGELLVSETLRVRQSRFDIEMFPEIPHAEEDVTARVHGIGSCVLFVEPEIGDHTILLSSSEGGICDPPGIYEPYMLDVNLGQLEAGTWEIEYEHSGFGGDSIRATHELEVLPAGSCQASDTSLCLGNGRFRVEADWETIEGQAGRGQAVETTEDSGSFWFFGPNNVELVVKVLDGCPIQGHYWVFASGITDVGVDLRVTDLWAGATWQVSTDAGEVFEPILDIEALMTCGESGN